MSLNSQYEEELIISVKEARKLLGKKFATFSDDEVASIVSLLTVIARDAVQSGSKINK